MKNPLACLLCILLLLDPLFNYAQNGGIPKVADFPEAFEALPALPLTVKLKNNIRFDQEGGHLQGIQLYQENTVYLSGSSSNYSYIIIGDLKNQVVKAVDTLLLSPLRHAGGFQIYDHFLAVGIEDNQKRDLAKVQVYDLEKDKPWQMPLASLERKGAPERVTAGAVGLTAYKEKMWLLVANWDSRVLDLYSCTEKDFYLGNAPFQLQMSIDLSRQDRNGWINPDWLSYQNLNLFTDKKEQMYVTGTALNPDGKQVADLFRLIPDKEKPVLVKIASKIFSTSEKVNFKAAAGLQVNQEGRLQLTGAPYQIEDETYIDLFSN
ncbi:hypothetical protein [Cyclobacterium plantarum]|uniref:Uncharacterized protein n=1 Tax=Cyclobacterium plantarum TaxID=2716263 RepID=A0ABX0H6R7_9BACT|nr:hypothetical protein [Cyclobacterium plantarum]NHE55912.1 hypothetical protein [Cyclobacterium plantarum]